MYNPEICSDYGPILGASGASTDTLTANAGQISFIKSYMKSYCKFRQRYYNYSYNGVPGTSATTDFVPNGSAIS